MRRASVEMTRRYPGAPGRGLAGAEGTKVSFATGEAVVCQCEIRDFAVPRSPG